MYYTSAMFDMPFHLARAVVLGANFILELENQQLVHNTAPLIDPYTITFYPLYYMELRRNRRYPISDFTTPYSILALTSIIKIRYFTDELTIIPHSLGWYILNNPFLLAHRCLSKNDRHNFLVRGVSQAIAGYMKHFKRHPEFPEFLRNNINFMLSYEPVNSNPPRTTKTETMGMLEIPTPTRQTNQDSY